MNAIIGVEVPAQQRRLAEAELALRIYVARVTGTAGPIAWVDCLLEAKVLIAAGLSHAYQPEEPTPARARST